MQVTHPGAVATETARAEAAEASRVVSLSPTLDTATSGALVANTYALISASGGNVSRALPSNSPLGAQIVVGKSDSGTHTVTATGKINGVSSSSVVLSAPGETADLLSDGAGGWLCVGGQVSAWADSRYQLAGTAVGSSLAFTDMATSATSVALASGSAWTDITGTPLTISPTLGTRTVEVAAQAVLTLTSATAKAIWTGIYDVTASAIIAAALTTLSSQFASQTVKFSKNVTPGAGTRTYKVMLMVTSASGVTVTVSGADNNNAESSLSCIQR